MCASKRGTLHHLWRSCTMLGGFGVIINQASPRFSCCPDQHRVCREGEDARCFLVECSERFLRRNALEGYDAHSQAGVLAIRSDVEAGRADVPAADIVAAEIKQVRLVAHGVALGRGSWKVWRHMIDSYTLWCKLSIYFMWLHVAPTTSLHAPLQTMLAVWPVVIPCNEGLVRYEEVWHMSMMP